MAGILPRCRELGIGFVPYSPLGAAFLTGTARLAEDYPPDDFRRNRPRFPGPDAVPIPGTERRTYLEENVATMGVQLSPSGLEKFRPAPRGAAAGARYVDRMMALLDR